MNKNIIIDGIKYQNVSKIKIKDAETSDLYGFVNADDATAESKDIMIGKSAYGASG